MARTDIEVVEQERPTEAGQPEALLSARGVSYSIEGQPILRDISFDVFSGEIFGVMGMSGSGKTTLLRLLIGLERPPAVGSSSVVGHHDPRRRWLNRVRRSMAMCFQYSALFDP